ncbi:hypothetical protein PRUPE_6G245900 [Prunus persica]|uniref:Uncharacterized protein n=1 Tax=Prunus persica TaxID=3760 RepID=A0A251NVA7_PRUPE|nr:hypothetical protein PRUPE_6G245900 [Prunus persica]
MGLCFPSKCKPKIIPRIRVTRRMAILSDFFMPQMAFMLLFTLPGAFYLLQLTVSFIVVSSIAVGEVPISPTLTKGALIFSEPVSTAIIW